MSLEEQFQATIRGKENKILALESVKQRMLGELRQSATDLTEAARLLEYKYPETAEILRNQAARTLAVIAKAEGCTITAEAP
jgi:hypothetical protein